MILLIAGWLIWGFLLLYGIGLSLIAINTDDLIKRHFHLTIGLVLLVSLVVHPYLSISRLWLLASVPVAYFMSYSLTSELIRREVHARFKVAKEESERTGTPIEAIMRRLSDTAKPK